MGLQAQLTAQLTTGPSAVSDNTFPSGVNTISFGLNPPQKQYNVDASGVVQVNSPSPAYAAVPAIGAGGQVTQALTFFARTLTLMVLQMTFANPSGGSDIVITEPVDGVKLCEYPTNGYLKALAVQGSGQLEYWAAGLV